MTATEILLLLQAGEKMGYKATIIINNILGKSEYIVRYDEYKIDDVKLFYNKKGAVHVKDVVAVRIGL